MMLFEVHQLVMIVVLVIEDLVQLLQLQLLSVKSVHWCHQVVSVSLVPERELNLIKFILDHYLIGKHVVEGARIRVSR